MNRSVSSLGREFNVRSMLAQIDGHPGGPSSCVFESRQADTFPYSRCFPTSWVTDSELPEGASVTVLVREGDETFEADPEIECMVLDSIAQRGRGETIPLTQLLGGLGDRE